VTNNNLNKRFFTEEDSPVPLIPTDMAWDNMQLKLKQEMPEEKKRRLFFWIPPFFGFLFFVLLTGTAVIIWWGQHISKTLQVKNENGTVQYPELKDSIAASAPVNNNSGTVNSRDAQPVATSSKNNEVPVNANDNAGSMAAKGNKQPTGILADTRISRRLTALNTRKAKNIQQPFSSVPTLTAHDQNGEITYLKKKPKRKRYHPEKSNRPVTSATAREEGDGTLPFVFSQQIVETDTIAVQTDRSLPGVLFQSPAKIDSIRKNAFWVEAGVQWNIPVPFNGFRYYLKGADCNNQVYRLALPGVWVSVSKNRQRIMATVNPFVTAPMPDKNFGTGMVSINDSMQMYSNKRMLKMFGYQVGLQYAYRFASRWWLGGGIDGNWWRKGLVQAKSVDSVAISKPFLYAVNPKTEEKITSFQMSANIALGYQYKDWEALMQVSTPFSKTIKGISSPVWLRLGVRWRLMNRGIQRCE
jgi:hypothetical protein